MPPPPTVYDVVEEAVDDLERRGTTFQRKHRHWAAGAALIFALLAGAIALARAVDGDVAAFVLLVVAIITGLGGVVLGRAGQRTTAITLLIVTPILLAVVAWTLGHLRGLVDADARLVSSRSGWRSGRCCSRWPGWPVVVWSAAVRRWSSR